jgi:hypothetical protein
MEARHGIETENESVHQKRVSETLLKRPSQRCSEPFDKVFGLLGLVKSQIQPDYETSRIELFLRVYIETVVEQNRYQILQNIAEMTESESTSSAVHEKKLLRARALQYMRRNC